jgi:hypothetical protein
MDLQFAERQHLQHDSEALANAEQLLAEIRDLPSGTQDDVMRELMIVISEYERNRRVDPVLHFIESLLATARLHRNARYLDAQAEAAHRPGTPDGPGLNHDDLVARFAELDRRRRGH